MGFNEYDDEHILEICKIAGVDDFVGSHPKGYDLEIRERRPVRRSTPNY